ILSFNETIFNYLISCLSKIEVIIYKLVNLKLKIKNCLAILLIVACTKVCAQNQWELSKNKNGIKVYTRKTDSSDFKAVKVDDVLTGTPGKLVDILMGIEKNIKWVYHTKTLRLIKRYSAN